MRPISMLACALWAALAAAPAAAQNQVKPYFLVVFDTSGSMDDPVNASAPEENSCAFGGANPSKMDEAKCALTKLVNATGDADFGLMQFAQTWDGAGSCSGGGCAPEAASALLRVPITTNTAPAIAALLDNTGTNGTQELCPNGYTPLGGTLAAAKDYFEGNLNYTGNGDPDPAPTASDTALRCRPLSVILLTDGVECCNNCANSSPYNIGCPNADQELIDAQLGACRTTCGSFGGCDNNDGFESAPEKAWLMREQSNVPRSGGRSDKRIPTYVIGFGIAEPDTRIERIAVGGGTDNPADGSGAKRAFYADDEDELAVAFSQIIADAQPPSEICNNEDDDCDTLIDEGIPKFCNKPDGITEKELCDEPDETICDGIDDDCDEIIDEGVLNRCGMCGDEPPEICDGLDNDCDSRVDEMTEGGACGTDEGRCEEGTERCVNGMLECRGEVGPRDETCNCMDDDCDGKIDEDVDGSLCPNGACIACECVPRCEPGAEFMPECDPGRRPDIQPSGECLCVIDNCDAPACQQMTIEREGKLACAPNDPTVARCLCRAGMCATRCDGVTCGSDQVCNPLNGRCAEDNCRGLGCPDGQLCDAVSAECVEDACADAGCADGEVCRGGACEPSCANVICMAGERCASGGCVDDPCADPDCASDEVCDPSSGECVANACDQTCPSGLTCTPSSGECERDLCWDVSCPEGQRCDRGECTLPGGPMSGGGAAGGSPGGGGDPNLRVLATGGGGCACHVAGGARAPSGSARGGLWLWLLGAGLLLATRRRARRAWVAIGLLIAAIALSGCEVSPFCIDCVDAGTDEPRAGQGPAGGRGGSSGTNSGGTGGTMADGGPEAGSSGDAGPLCREPIAETCDGKDQDCDFKVDEEVESEENDCVQFGVCEGTRPICLAGEFECRYPDAREDSETLCDGIDNDCDNRTDEGFPTLGDECDIGVGACKTEGSLVCDATMKGVTCEGEAGDPDDEICDGIDNDCDTLVDEPRSEPGSEPSFVEDDVVQVDSDLWVYRFEASRPDATGTQQGGIASRACSRAGVMPWTNLTYDEAVAACEAADMQLCSESDWVNACEGADGCAWSFVAATPANATCPTGDTGYPPTASPDNKSACNGHNLEAEPGEPDTDALAATGAYARCFTLHGAEQVFDLSGNAKEWVTGPDSGASSNPISPLRGGSFNNLPGGLRCNFEFAVAKNTVRLRNVGFRCCKDSAP